VHIDTIWLNKPKGGDSEPDTWVYYRVTPVAGGGQPAGADKSNVEVCRLHWPTLEDLTGFSQDQGIVETAGSVGLVSAELDTTDIVKGKFGIDHRQSILMGIRERPSS
jgi:hypothetical protein